MNKKNSRKSYMRFRVRTGLALTLFGLLIYILGLNPALFHLDRSPVVGFVQIAVFLVGLAIICLGGYLALNTLWNGREKSIGADIGFRLVSTGYVIAVASGMADVLGFGTQSFPEIPFFGIWQSLGVISGTMTIAIGFILMIPFEGNSKDKSESE